MTELESALLDAVRAGMDMRAAQARYFKTRHGTQDKVETLKRAKIAESMFDSKAANACRLADNSSEGR